MSSPGSDPLDALLAQQAQGAPAPTAAAPVDSIDAALAQQAAAPANQGMSAPQAQTASKPQSLWDQLSDYAHGIKNGSDLPSLIGETGAELGAKGTDYLGLTHGAAPMLQQAFKESNNYGEAQPTSKYSQGGQMLGNVFATLPVAGINPVAGEGIIPAAANSALQGGIGTAVTSPERNGISANEVGQGALLGGAVGTGGYALGKMLQGATRSPAAQLLANEGVRLTPGQSLGGTAHTLEDASTHIPMLGNAIKGRQGDAITDFNRATYNRVLSPLGVSYAPDGPVGNEGIQHINGVISKAYDNAYQSATVRNTDNFQSSLNAVKQQAADSLPADRAAMIGNNIDRLINNKMGRGGQLQSDDLIAAKNWFAEQSRASPTASLDDRATANAAGQVVDALKDGIAETSPDKGKILDAADNAYMRSVKLSQAASQNASSGRGGIFTPSQLGAALRSTDNSTRRMNFATGKAPMQDLAQAGQQVLPSTVPDSGTALRGMLELGAGGAITHEISPEAAMGAAGLIGGGAALYSRPGQTLARALLHGAPVARKAMGAIPQAITPGLTAALLSQRGNNP